VGAARLALNGLAYRPFMPHMDSLVSQTGPLICKGEPEQAWCAHVRGLYIYICV